MAESVGGLDAVANDAPGKVQMIEQRWVAHLIATVRERSLPRLHQILQTSQCLGNDAVRTDLPYGPRR